MAARERIRTRFLWNEAERSAEPDVSVELSDLAGESLKKGTLEREKRDQCRGMGW